MEFQHERPKDDSCGAEVYIDGEFLGACETDLKRLGFISKNKIGYKNKMLRVEFHYDTLDKKLGEGPDVSA